MKINIYSMNKKDKVEINKINDGFIYFNFINDKYTEQWYSVFYPDVDTWYISGHTHRYDVKCLSNREMQLLIKCIIKDSDLITFIISLLVSKKENYYPCALYYNKKLLKDLGINLDILRGIICVSPHEYYNNELKISSENLNTITRDEKIKTILK